jgi:YVTN family beta-propeller protein
MEENAVNDQPAPASAMAASDAGKASATRNVEENSAGRADTAAETLLVVRKSFNALDFIDASCGRRLRTVEVGVAPHEVGVAPDGRRAVVSNYGTPEQPGTTLRIVDIERAAETAFIDLGRHTRPHGVAWFAPGRIAVTTEGSRHLLVVSPDEKRVETAIETGQEMSHMVAVSTDGGHAYVANIRSGSLTVIDLAAGRKIADLPTGGGSEGLALTRDGREVWVCARAENRMTIVNAQSLEIAASIAVAAMPIRVAMSPDGLFAYVTCAAAGALLAIDVAARKVVGSHSVNLPLAAGAASRPFARLGPGSPLPIGLAVSPFTKAIYVAATMADRVQVLDASSLEAVRAFDVGGEPDGIAVSIVRRSA